MTDLISKQQDQVRLSLFNRIALAVHLSGMGEPFDLQALAQGFARAVHDGVIVGMADAALFADFIA